MELELQEYWERKLWQLAEAKPIQYLSSQDLTTFWQIKLWRIGNEPPNPPKFSPTKVLCYMVITVFLIFLRVILSYYTAITFIQHTLFVLCMALV